MGGGQSEGYVDALFLVEGRRLRPHQRHQLRLVLLRGPAAISFTCLFPCLHVPVAIATVDSAVCHLQRQMRAHWRVTLAKVYFKVRGLPHVRKALGAGPGAAGRPGRRSLTGPPTLPPPPPSSSRATTASSASTDSSSSYKAVQCTLLVLAKAWIGQGARSTRARSW